MPILSLTFTGPDLLYGLVKVMLGFILLLNIRAFPFVWHLRVFRPPTYFWLWVHALEFRTLFSSHATRDRIMEAFFEKRTPIGCNLLEYTTVYRSHASVDECDCNLHLSNSSYPKAIDCATVKTVTTMFPNFVRTDGWLALAGTHFHFIREIPILTRYEVRVNIVAWDQKWVYAFCRFVAHGSTSRPFLRVSLGRSRSSNDSAISSNIDLREKVNRLDITEPDGAIVHAIAVSQLCFKMGRITVPPALVFASNGFTTPSSSPSPPSPAGYSRDNPPPHWKIVKEMISRLEGGDIKNLKSFYQGGWRDVPTEHRWWEQALDGELEMQRRQNLDAFSMLKQGMENLQERPM